jgi:CheY-like chemotaxis protein/anti-sigma regulatory factor (Ser/Thr protein kinase)
VLHEKGLAAGLEWLGRQMQQKHGLSVDVRADAESEPASEEIRLFLFEAVRELLLNIVKYAQVDRAQVRMRMLESNEVEITVADSGIGFDPAQLGTSAPTTGGFGLFSIRERLNYLGGRMVIHAAPGQGSVFTIVTPARLDRTAIETRRTGSEKASTQGAGSNGPTEGASFAADRKINVVIADDHPVLRHGLAKLLEEQPDIQVVGEAGDGRTVIELARKLKPDVVLMDVSLPVVNGFEATRQIVFEFPNVRVIGLSMHEETEMAKSMYNAGAVAYLTKGGPIEPLIAAIRAQVVEKLSSH